MKWISECERRGTAERGISRGTPGLAGHVPPRDASVVAALRTAGAIVLGKTNTPELTLSAETDNTLFGRTSNPYDVSRTAAGSSNGSGIATAMSFAAATIGTDPLNPTSGA